MKHHSMRQEIWSGRLLASLIVSVAVLVGGCQSQAPPLSPEAQTVKKALLREMEKLTTALTKPVAQQDWQAIKPILPALYEEMKKSGKVVPSYMVVMDRDGVVQDRLPHRQVEHFNFMSYDSVKIVFQGKKKAQDMLYFGGNKVFVFLAPVFNNDQVIGAAAMGFSEKELQRWKVAEKEFVSIDFNQEQ